VCLWHPLTRPLAPACIFSHIHTHMLYFLFCVCNSLMFVNPAPASTNADSCTERGGIPTLSKIFFALVGPTVGLGECTRPSGCAAFDMDNLRMSRTCRCIRVSHMHFNIQTWAACA